MEFQKYYYLVKIFKLYTYYYFKFFTTKHFIFLKHTYSIHKVQKTSTFEQRPDVDLRYWFVFNIIRVVPK